MFKIFKKAGAFVTLVLIFIFFLCYAGFFIFRILPNFKGVFESFGAELPWITKVVLNTAEFCREKVFLVLPATLAAVFAVLLLVKRLSTLLQWIIVMAVSGIFVIIGLIMILAMYLPTFNIN